MTEFPTFVYKFINSALKQDLDDPTLSEDATFARGLAWGFAYLMYKTIKNDERKRGIEESYKSSCL